MPATRRAAASGARSTPAPSKMLGISSARRQRAVPHGVREGVLVALEARLEEGVVDLGDLGEVHCRLRPAAAAILAP